MSHFSGYGAYMLFVALRTHFDKSNYDFFQMNGKLRASKESYYKRNDRKFFEKIAKDYNAEALRDFYIANILEDRIYITELLDEKAEDAYNDYTRRRQSLSYIYTNELGRVFNDDLKKPFIVSDSAYPVIVLLFLRREISIESMVVLDDLTGFTRKFNKHYEDDIIWFNISKKMSKYRPFLKYDKDKMRKILKEIIDGNAN